MTTNRQCGDCNACCVWPTGKVYGIKFGNGKPCAFLNKNCAIHPLRPKMCRNYECGWLQELFPEWMRPDKCKVLVYFSTWSKGQYLHAIELEGTMSDSVLAEIEKFILQHRCPAIIQKGGQFLINGPDEFLQEKKPAE